MWSCAMMSCSVRRPGTHCLHTCNHPQKNQYNPHTFDDGLHICYVYVCFMFVLLKRTTEQKLAVPMNFCESESQSHSQSATVDVYKGKDVF